MSSDSYSPSQTGSRRRFNGGGRRRGYGHRGGNMGRRRSYEDRDQYNKPAKKGFFAFLKNLFGFGKKNGASNGIPARKYSSEPTHSHEPRPVQVMEVTSPKLYVGNLSYETSESDLYDLFQQVGSVKNVEIVRDRQTNSKGFGFVEMQTLETAKEASTKFHQTEFMGRSIVVSGAKS